MLPLSLSSIKVKQALISFGLSVPVFLLECCWRIEPLCLLY